jgi:HAMP domain-containing protein
MRDALSGGERDVMLVSRTGTILIGPPDLEGTAPTVPSLLALRQGAARTQIETWPNGESYLTAVVTPIAYRDLPSFGWSLVVRQRAEAAAAPAQAITRRLGFALGLAGLVALAGSVVLGSVIARPLRRLGLSAEAIAEGRFGDPVPDMRGVVEIRTIADGLMRVQSRLMESEPPGPPPPAARRRDEAEETAR